jgi:SOS response regulatory protein OraA/RecX
VEALAGLAISIVAPYIAKGAEAFAQEVGSEAFSAVKAVADRLRSWWSGEPVAAAAAESLPSEPEKYSTILTQLLSSDLANDEAFATELRALTERVGPNVQVVQRIEVAKGVTGADIEQLVTGDVRVEQEMKEAEDVTGFKAKRVGG